jgi:hypothetical protein
MFGKMWLLAANRDVDIGDFIAFLDHHLHHFAKDSRRVGAFPSRIIGREMFTNVTKGKGAQDGIAHGVVNHVRVAMSKKLFVKWDMHAREDDFIAIDQLVDIFA